MQLGAGGCYLLLAAEGMGLWYIYIYVYKGISAHIYMCKHEFIHIYVHAYTFALPCPLPICHMQSMPGLRLPVRVFSTWMHKTCVDSQNYLTANDEDNNKNNISNIQEAHKQKSIACNLGARRKGKKIKKKKSENKNNSRSWLYSFQFAITCQLAN